jgi:hypothetical protein
LACAQCHDHKYDPYPQRDYYRLLAFFNSDAVETSTDEAGVVSDVSPRLEWSTAEMSAEFARIELELARTTKTDERQRLTATRDAVKPVPVLVMQAHHTRRPTYIFERGSFLTPGERVTAGAPSILESLVPTEGDDRLALARWLVDKRNPLTARVAMNRLWAQYFGRGLIETLDDFGTQGAPCSHPELLDWLAVEFMRQDWKFKPLHRLILMSATYRQSALATAAKTQLDPDNRLLSRAPRIRLSAELVRDNALAAAGILSTELGGPSILTEKLRTRGSESGTYRRSIYLRWKRLTLDDALVNFDAPSRDVTCTQRTRTNTPLQALTLLNDRTFLDAARGLAARTRAASDDWNEQLDFAFLASLARTPLRAEREVLRGLYERRLAAFAQSPQAAGELLLAPAENEPANDSLADQAAWVALANTILNLNEFITRE